MATAPRPELENHSGQSKSEPDRALRLTINDLGERPNTSGAQHAETPTQPLTRERANTNLSEINERHNVDQMRATEIARAPYRLPESQSGRSQALQEHRESTASTGFAGQRTLTDANGKQMKGLESYDKNSGQRTFYGESKDGGYQPYHIQNGGKILQPLDSNGKPAGDPIRMQGQQERQEGGKLGSLEKAAQENQAKVVQNMQALESSALKASDSSARQFAETHRVELHGHLAQNVRSTPEHLNNIYRTLSVEKGDFTAKLPQRNSADADNDRTAHNKHLDAHLITKDIAAVGKSILMMADATGRQIGHLLDFLSRHQHMLDRVPNADQSRLLIRESMRSLRMDEGNKQDLTQSVQLQRFLNQRNTDSSAQNQQSFVIRSQQTGVLAEITSRLKSHDIVTNIKQGSDGKSESAVSGRILDTANMTQSLEQSKSLNDFADKNSQATKHQQVLQADKQLDSKIDAGKMKSENNDESKGGGNVSKEDKQFTTGEATDGISNGLQGELMNTDQMALLLANKLKDLKEKEEQKEKTQDKDKKDPQNKTRFKYRTQEGDTLASLSERFLHDSQLAAVIFHINRTVIPVTIYNGKSYSSLSVEMLIWIPSDDDIALFKNSESVKEYQQIGFAGVKYASAEEELLARFGNRWYGASAQDQATVSTNSNDDTEGTPIDKSLRHSEEKTQLEQNTSVTGMNTSKKIVESEARRANIEKILGTLSSRDKSSSEAVNTERPIRRSTIDRSTRRANIEKVLGPFSSEQESTSDRARYSVRLGESLKSIALKHPILQNVELWKVLAACNGLSTQTDAKGCPVTVLKRGMTLTLPTQAELAAFRLNGTLPAEAGLNDLAANSKEPTNTAGSLIAITVMPAPITEAIPPTQESLEDIATATEHIAASTEHTATSAENAAASPENIVVSTENFATSTQYTTEPTEFCSNREDIFDEAFAKPSTFQNEYQNELSPELVTQTTNTEYAEPSNDTSNCDNSIDQGSFQKWREQVTKASLNELDEFFLSHEEGDRELVLSRNSDAKPAARLLAHGSKSNIALGYRLSLEVLNGQSWESIIEYDMSASGSTQKTFDGSYRRSRPLNLPCAEVFQIARNDLARNWENYVSLFAE